MARRLDLSRGVGGGRLGGGRLERLDLSRGVGGGGGPRPAITAITALLVGGGRCVEWGGRLGVARRLDLSRGVGGGRLGGGRLERLDLSRGVGGGVLVLPTPSIRRRRRIDGVGCLIALDLSCIYRKYKYM